MIAESLLKEIDRGRKGLNQGFSIGMPKLESIIDGVTKATSTLLFSTTGSGKSSLALYAYVYMPLKEHLEDGNFKVSYFSLEMSAEAIFAKLLSMYLFDTYGVDVSLKELFSRKRNYSLPDELYHMVQDSMEWLHKVEKVVTIYDKSCNAKIVYAALMAELEKDGEFQDLGKRKIYIPNNPNLIHLVIIDHISLLQPPPGVKLKEEIDKTSAYLVTLRNMCGISPLIIMQANRESGSMDRRKYGLNNLRIDDTKDSGNVAQDSEIIISIFNPHREKLTSYNGYDISILQDKFRSITVLKNRYGDSDVEVGVNFFGHCGLWHELPRSEDIYDMARYTDPSYLLNAENNEIDNTIVPDEITEESNKITFKL